MRTSRLLIAAAAVAGFAVTAAQAETIWGITDTGAGAGGSLVNFDSATPGSVTTVGALSGAIAGHGVRGIDFRPATGALYALSTDATGGTAQIYTVDLATGAMTAQGASFALTGNTSLRVSMDFNPAADRLRIVTADTVENNFRWNPVTNAFVQADTSLAYAAGDPNNPAGNPPFIIGAAYDRNDNDPLTGTTLYAWDFNLDVLATIGSVNGTPNSPNGGQMNTVGGPASFLTNDGGLGFDISGVTGAAYLSYTDFASLGERLATLDLGTGLPTVVGPIGATMLDISAAPVPEPASISLLGLAAAGLLRRRR